MRSRAYIGAAAIAGRWFPIQPKIAPQPPDKDCAMTETPAIDLESHPLTHWDGPLGLPDFTRVRDDDFGPVFDAALAAHDAEIETIAANPATSTVENTIEALERCGEPLDRVSAIFWCRAGANTNDAIQSMEREISPKMSRHFSAISMN